MFKYCLSPGRSGTQRSERRARKFKTFWKKTLGSSRFRYCCLQKYLKFRQSWSSEEVFINVFVIVFKLKVFVLAIVEAELQKVGRVLLCYFFTSCANFRRFYWTKVDWIVRPGYSSGGYILGCSQRFASCLQRSARIGPDLLCHMSSATCHPTTVICLLSQTC